MSLENRRTMLTNVGGGNSIEDVPLYLGDIVVDVPTQNIKIPSLVSLKGLKLVKFNITVGKNEIPNVNYNDNFSMFVGDHAVSYGRLADPTDIGVHTYGWITSIGNQGIFVKNVKTSVGLNFNKAGLETGCSYKVVDPDYEHIRFNVFGGNYQGTIKLELYGNY